MIDKRILIIIRHSSERTFLLSKNKALLQADTIDIRENPFQRTIKKTWEIGASSLSYKWILALDADVLLNDNIISEISRIAEYRFNKMQLFRLDFLVKDKFRGKVYAGCHLYRQDLLNDAVEIICNYDFEWDKKRPESKSSSIIAKKMGIENHNEKTIITGLHDFEQWYKDIYVKYFNRGIKDKKCIEKIYICLDEKRLHNPDDMDYIIAIKGLLDSREYNEMFFDWKKYPNINTILKDIGIKEKEPLYIN